METARCGTGSTAGWGLSQAPPAVRGFPVSRPEFFCSAPIAHATQVGSRSSRFRGDPGWSSGSRRLGGPEGGSPTPGLTHGHEGAKPTSSEALSERFFQAYGSNDLLLPSSLKTPQLSSMEEFSKHICHSSSLLPAGIHRH